MRQGTETVSCALAGPDTVLVQELPRHILHKMTLGNGYLGSRIDEERSEMRYLV